MADKFINSIANDGSLLIQRMKDNLDGTYSLDVNTGLSAGGSGGGSSVVSVPVIDSAAVPKRFLMTHDLASNVITFYNFGTNVVATPTFPVYPEADSSSSEPRKIAAVKVNGVTLIKDLTKTRVHVDAAGNTISTYHYTTDGQFAGES